MMEIKDYVLKRKQELAAEVSSFKRKPCLTIIQANDNPASDAYIRGKLKDGEEIGAKVTLLKLPSSTTEGEILGLINKANKDPEIDGLIVQLPLPKQISEEDVKLAIEPKKDVDGFHPLSKCSPCTPQGIIDYLSHEGFPFCGANAVVIGRSDIVGRPMTRLLLNKDCNVTVLHSKTKKEDLQFYLAHADLIVVAVGRLGFLDLSYSYKKTAYVVDVGINRGADGKLHGDCLPGLPVAYQTPVPGGVGLLTRLALFDNLMEVISK